MTRQPNVLFYVSDSLRAGNLSCYGYDRETSPHVDRLASDGIRFDSVFSQAFKTVESSVSILTGLYPPTHGAYTTRHPVPSTAPRIAKRLREEGYMTGGFSSLVQISKRRDFDKGFDTFAELFKEYGSKGFAPDWAKLCTDHTIDWIEEIEEPFFAFVWSNGTHNPYSPRSEKFTDETTNSSIDGSLESLRQADLEDSTRVRNLYDDTIHHADHHFGRLVDFLKRKGIYDDTLIIFTADHGEILSEHGRMEHAYSLPKRGIKMFVPKFVQSRRLFEPGAHVGHLSILPYNELLHVPGIVKLPGCLHAGETRDQMVETVDLMPTVAEVTDVPFDTQGTSLDTLIKGGGSGKDNVYSDTAISRGIVNFRSVRSNEHKLIRTDWNLSRLKDRESLRLKKLLASLMHKSICKSEVLLELPDEAVNAAQDRAEVQKSLRAKYQEWLTQCETVAIRDETTDIDEETRDQLSELGYLE